MLTNLNVRPRSAPTYEQGTPIFWEIDDSTNEETLKKDIDFFVNTVISVVETAFWKELYLNPQHADADLVVEACFYGGAFGLKKFELHSWPGNENPEKRFEIILHKFRSLLTALLRNKTLRSLGCIDCEEVFISIGGGY